MMETENPEDSNSSSEIPISATNDDGSVKDGGYDEQIDKERQEIATDGIHTDQENKIDDTIVDSQNVIDNDNTGAIDVDITNTEHIEVTEALSGAKSDSSTDKDSDYSVATNNASQPSSGNDLVTSSNKHEENELNGFSNIHTSDLVASSTKDAHLPAQEVDKNSMKDVNIDETVMGGNTDTTPIAKPPNANDSAATLQVLPAISAEDNAKIYSKDKTDSWQTDGVSSSVDGIARLQINDDNVDTVGGDAGNGDIVVVTGGCGFLGQHVVKMLQTRAQHVSEIRVLDVKEFQQKLDYTAKKPVRSIAGSVSDSRVVNQAVHGAHSVIHVAGLISWGTFPDMVGMEETNVLGTVNVFNACIKNNVRRLLYCSTVDVAVGHQPIEGGDEDNTPVPPPDGFMFPGYPETKYQGERVVLNSARVLKPDGENLQTVILRANVLYGELDTSYVINGLRGASQSKGVLRQIGDGMAMFQQSYAGNTAWAFVCADQAMRENPELTAEVFYVPDHTPVQNSFNFMRPYLESREFRLSESRLSYPLVHSAVRVAEVLAKGLSPIYKFNLPVQSYSVQYINTSIYFSGEKAKKMLGYEPIFTPNEARQACLDYYRTVELD